MRTAVLVTISLLLAAFLVPAAPGEAQDPALELRVGSPDEMKTRNPLSVTAGDPSTRAVLDRVYERPLKQRPEGDLLPYIAKGLDSDEDGTFERPEYGRWSEQLPTATPLEVIVYYDFNGVRWHDGEQVTHWDLLFSYHVAAMDARLNGSLLVLFPAGPNGSYEAGNRQLNVEPASKVWEGEGAMPGSPTLRVALRFRPSEPFARFSERTLSPVLFPMHVWSRTGGARHADFGCAIWIPTAEANARGIPECGTTTPSRWGTGIAASEAVPGSNPFDLAAAQAWSPADADVIGTGPFRFERWIPGVEARVLRYDDYYTGMDRTTGTVYDPALAVILKLPTLEAVRYKVYRTTQLGVFALQSGEIDFYNQNVGAEFVPDLLKSPYIAIEVHPEPGLYYLGYNLRKAPFGYEGDDPAKDVGYLLRQAVAHLVDKKSIVQNRLQNFGVVLHGFITPANAFWYNESIRAPAYDLAAATAILDSPEARAVGIGPDPPGSCNKDAPAGCRSLPGIGTASFEILNPQTDYGYTYDPFAIVAESMRQVGLNALLRPTAFGEILQRIDAHNFDMFVLGWRFPDPDPHYLFELFHSSRADDGENYVGFRDPGFDSLIEASHRELDREARRQLIWEAQEVLLDKRPAEPVYARTNIEGYRQDRFINWTVVMGTIWNEWSLFRIRPPPHLHLRIAIEVPSAVRATDSEPVTVRVTDELGIAVASAAIVLSTTLGTLTVGSTTASVIAGNTSADGRFDATFTAPSVAEVTDAVLVATARHWDYADEARDAALLRVWPMGVAFLSLDTEFPIGDLGRPGDILPLRLRVRDQDRLLVPDAVVTLASPDPSVVRPVPENGTAEALAVVSLELGPGVENLTTLGIIAVATKPGFLDANLTFFVTVVPETASFRCPTGETVLDVADCPLIPPLDARGALAVLAGAIGVAAVIASLIVSRWRRRGRRFRRDRGNA